MHNHDLVWHRNLHITPIVHTPFGVIETLTGDDRILLQYSTNLAAGKRTFQPIQQCLKITVNGKWRNKLQFHQKWS